MKHLLILSALLPLLLLRADFEIVRGGEPRAVIVLEQKPTRSAQMGAFELQHCVKLITGATLPIVRGEPAQDGKNIIRIGGGNEGMEKESNKIEFNGNTLLITGHDSPLRWGVNYQDPVTFPQMYEYKGTLFGVYDFLELYCGVFFYGTDELGTTYRTSPDLVVKEKNRRFTPSLDAFRWVYGGSGRDIFPTPRDNKLFELRWRMSAHFGRVSHNTSSIYFAHWDKAKDPNLAKAFKSREVDYFAKGYEGKYFQQDAFVKSNFPAYKQIPPQICYSSKGAAEFFADEVVTYYRGGNVIGGWNNREGKHDVSRPLYPKRDGIPFYYPLEGNDNGGFCTCERCRRRFPADNEKSFSNSKFQFMSDVAKLAAEKQPGAGVATLAYYQTYAYPEHVDLAENLSVQLCPVVYQWWHPVIYAKQFGEYRKWMKNEAKRRPMTLWTYLFSPYWDARHYGGYKPFPGLYPWKAGEIFKMFTADGIRGWFSEAELKTNFLEAYVAARICYDPSLDPDKIIDDFFVNYFGDAGPAMKEFYAEIQRAYWNPGNCPAEWYKDPEKVIVDGGHEKHPFWGTGIHSPDVNWKMGTPERMKKLQGLIDQAQKLVKTPREKARLDRIVNGIWSNAVEGEKEYKQLQLRKKTPPRTIAVSKDDVLDIGSLDWAKAVKADNWKKFNGDEHRNSCSMRIAADKENLYLRFTEDVRPPTNGDMWNENIELFFGGDYPVYHLAVSPAGMVSELIHTREKRIPGSREVKIAEKVDCRVSDNSWSVVIVLPWKKLPALKDGRLPMNFMRTGGSVRLMWSPTCVSGYLDGLKNFGILDVYPRDIHEDRMRYHKRHVNADIENDPAASNGKAAMMIGNRSWSVQYLFPKNFIPGTYRISAAIRSDVPAVDGVRFSIGIYDQKRKQVRRYKMISAKDVSGEKYKLIELGTWPVEPDCYLYLGGFQEGKFPDKKIYVDFIRLDVAK